MACFLYHQTESLLKQYVLSCCGDETGTVVEDIVVSLHTINFTKYHLAPHDYALVEFEWISHLFMAFV